MKTNALRNFAIALLLSISNATLSAQATTPAVPAISGSVVKQMGAIKKITGSDLSLVTDQGGELSVKIQPSARILRLAPGQTDLKSAAIIELSDLQAGDRILVRGKLSDNGASVDASAVIVMKQQEIAQKQQQDLLDWQRRSIGGLVTKIDAEAGVITLSVGNKIVVVNTTAKTTYRRYAPDSVKWEDASTAKLADVHPGDQLRAKGEKNADGTVISAEEIVEGTFRNIAGVITAIDPAQATLTVQDLATKKLITVRVTPDSQMKKLPAQLSQGLAMRMKHGSTPASSTPAGAPGDAARPRGGDLNQLLARLPASSLGELQKGEAVMIVSTQGSAAQPPIAVTLLGGVEAILTASPTGSGVQSLLSPWSLAGSPSGDQ